MQLRQPSSARSLPPELHALLVAQRQRRRFVVDEVLEAKLALLRTYFTRHGLKAAVVGVSGGLDSAVVALLLARLASEPASPLHRLVLMTLPCRHHEGVSGQESSVERAHQVAEACRLPLTEVAMAPLMQAFHSTLEQALHIPGQAWARGQAVAYARTPLLYSATSLLAQQGLPAVVMGTTNRDEGAWLGYVGKASDGMVDIQPISDLHKSEVAALGRALGVPAAVLDVVPTGDMFDGAPDEAVFGAPYDFVELALLWRSQMSPAECHHQARAWSSATRRQFLAWMGALRRLHRANRHKYAVGSPAIHLDVLPADVRGGRSTPPRRLPSSTLSPSLAGPMVWPAGDRQTWVSPFPSWEPLAGIVGHPEPVQRDQVQGWRSVVSSEGVQALRQVLAQAPWVPAGAEGRWKVHREGDPVGSWRATATDPALAHALWEELRHHLPPFRHWSSEPDTDIGACPVWRPVGVSPVFRAIRYPHDGELVAHYDAPFIEAPGRRTLMSLVIVVEAGPDSGTEFLVDAQRAQSWSQRRFNDAPRGDETLREQWFLDPGDAMVFDHRLRHRARLGGHARLILRSDIVFEQVLP